MREYTLDELEPAREIVARVNLESLPLEGSLKRVRNNDSELEKFLTVACISNWKMLFRTGGITSLGPREWLMAWDD